MTYLPILKELAIIAALGMAVTALLSKLRLPTVAGLLTAGALVGPFVLGLVGDIGAIEALADVGVILLLFTIGLEFSVERLTQVLRQAALGGFVQVVATIAATAAVAMALGQRPARAVFYGFVLSLSSTAIVLGALSEGGETDAPHGRFIVGTLIFQDLCVIPMVLLVPVFGDGKSLVATVSEIGIAMGKAVVVVASVLILSKLLVPRLLRWVDASRGRETFLLAILALCIGTAWLTSLVGLSLALGAFLGGMIVADTEFQHRAMGEMIPLRNAFVSLFFVSLGMLFDPRILVTQPLVVAVTLFGFVVAKGVIAALSAVLLRFPPRAAWLAGVGLAQFGEFGFVLLKLGDSVGLTDRATFSALLSAGILSMFFAPLLIRAAPHLTAGERMLAPLTRVFGVRRMMQPPRVEPLTDHVVVIGYGIAGQLVSQSLNLCSIPYTALELNAETVRRARATGEPVHYADATSPESLHRANVPAARLVVVLINDPKAATRVVASVHRVAPNIPVVIRTRYYTDRARLMAVGATEVISEEVEASIEVLTRLLRRLEVPRNVIEARIREAREQMQTSERKITVPRSILREHRALGDLKIESMLITAHSFALGRSSLELDVRRKTGALVVAIRRGDNLLEQPDPDEHFSVGDVVYFVGSNQANRAVIKLLDAGEVRQPSGP
jgi:monovalent cation:H+ antiporter-2, CPA2 family